MLKVFLVLKLLEGEVPQQQMIVNFEPIGCHANNALNLGVVLSGIEHKAQISWCFCSALVYLVGFIVREMHRGVTRHINVCVLVMVL